MNLKTYFFKIDNSGPVLSGFSTGDIFKYLHFQGFDVSNK